MASLVYSPTAAESEEIGEKGQYGQEVNALILTDIQAIFVICLIIMALMFCAIAKLLYVEKMESFCMNICSAYRHSHRSTRQTF